MNTGQMMLGIFALGILTLVSLNYNSGSINTQDALTYNKEFILSTTIAQSMLDEINSKAYDEEIVLGKTIYSANDFSSSLKKDGGESYPNFDDVDDYNYFSKNDTIPNMGIFNVFVEVTYMTDKLIPTSSRTYNKNVTVRVTSPSLINYYSQKQDTLVLSSLYSQWTML
jgi:hypothetical protein